MEILKICRIHGYLTKKDVVKKGRLDTIEYRCNLCYKEIKRKYYEKNKEKVLQKNAEYRKADPAKRAAQKIKSALNNPYSRKKYVEKDYEYWKKSKENLTDMYVKRLICKRSGLKHADIPQNLIDFVRDAKMFKEKIKEIRIVKKIDKHDEKTGITND